MLWPLLMCQASTNPPQTILVTGVRAQAQHPSPKLPREKSLCPTSQATEGLGLVAAQQIAKAGHTVLVHGRNTAKVEGVVRQLEEGSGGGRAFGYVADLSSMAQVRQLGAQVSAAWPSLDGSG